MRQVRNYRVKYSLCENFVSYLLDHKLTQRELADKIGIDEALVSKIVHYNFDDFTIDLLIKYLAVIYPNRKIQLLVA